MAQKVDHAWSENMGMVVNDKRGQAMGTRRRLVHERHPCHLRSRRRCGLMTNDRENSA